MHNDVITTNDAIVLSADVKEVRIVVLQSTIKDINLLLKVSSCKTFWTPLLCWKHWVRHATSIKRVNHVNYSFLLHCESYQLLHYDTSQPSIIGGTRYRGRPRWCWIDNIV